MDVVLTCNLPERRGIVKENFMLANSSLGLFFYLQISETLAFYTCFTLVSNAESLHMTLWPQSYFLSIGLNFTILSLLISLLVLE